MTTKTPLFKSLQHRADTAVGPVGIGDAFTWVMKTQNIDFVDALKLLAADTRVVLPKDSRRVEPSGRAAQDAAMQEALSFFQSQLDRNKDAKEYCERRGLDEAARQMWELGYAPHDGSALATHLKKRALCFRNAARSSG